MTTIPLANNILSHIQTFLPEIGLVLIGFYLLMSHVFMRTPNAYETMVHRYLPLLIGSIFIALRSPLMEAQDIIRLPLGIKRDALTLFFGEFLLVLFTAFCCFSPQVLATANIRAAAYHPLNVFALLGMFVTLSANSCLTMFVGLELQALCFYTLICLRRNMSTAVEGAVKYYTLGALAAGLLLMGCAFFYGATGELGFNAPLTSNPESPFSALFVLSMFFILVALLFKLAAAPFHFWSPDVYQGTSNAQLTFLTIGPKITIVALMIRLIVGPFSFLVKVWQPLLIGIIILSLLIGTFSALRQTNIRRLLAYSAIAHVGFILMGFLSGGVDLSPLLIYVVAYAVSIFGFLFTLSHLHNEEFEISDISDLKGLAQTHPFMAMCLTIFLFSMAGIPPLAGFWGKFYVIIGVVEQEFFKLALFAVVSTIVGAYYYLRLIKLMYFDAPSLTIKAHRGNLISLLFAAFVVLFPVLQVYFESWFISIAKQLPLGL